MTDEERAKCHADIARAEKEMEWCVYAAIGICVVTPLAMLAVTLGGLAGLR